MNEPLRPSSLGEILDRTAQVYRSRFLVFLGISVIPTGAMLAVGCGVALVVSWWSVAGAASVSREAGYALAAFFSIGVALLSLPIFLAVTALAAAAMNHAVSRIYLGETATIRDAYKSVWQRGWHYVGLYTLQVFIVFIAPCIAWFGMVILATAGAGLARKAGMDASGGALLGLAAILLLAGLVGYAIWTLLRLSLAFPTCVVEQTGAWAALKRSSVLSNGTKGRIFLLYLLGVALTWLLSMGVTLPLMIILFLIPGMNSPQRAQTAGMAMIFIMYSAVFAIQTLIKPVYGIALVLFYYDQRIRREGFDIEWLMRQAGMAPEPAATPKAAPWLPAVQRKRQAAEPDASGTAPETGLSSEVAHEPGASA